MRLKIFIVFSLLNIACSAYGQIYIGITSDFGNRVSMNPKPPTSLLKSPIAPSGSLILLKQEQLKNNWFLQYSVGVGMLGYIMKFSSDFDTLHIYTGETAYIKELNYYLLYLNGHLSVGKQFCLGNKNITVSVGGGGTHQWDTESSSSLYVCDDASCSSDTKTFEYVLRQTSKLKFFAEASAQTNINSRFIIGMKYRYHFSPCLEGTYNFYHTKEATSGSLALSQRALSIFFLIRIGKNVPTR